MTGTGGDGRLQRFAETLRRLAGKPKDQIEAGAYPGSGCDANGLERLRASVYAPEKRIVALRMPA